MPLLGLAQPRSYDVKLLCRDWSNCMLDYVGHDVIGRVVRSCGLSLAFVIFEIEFSSFYNPLMTFDAFALSLAQIFEGHINVACFLLDDCFFLVCDAQFELKEAFVD